MKIKLYDEELKKYPEVNQNLYDPNWMQILGDQIALKKSEVVLIFDLNINQMLTLSIDEEQFKKIQKQIKEKKSEINI